MADAIDNLAQDLNQVGVMPYESLILTDEGYVNTIPNPNFVEPYAYPNPPRFGLPPQPPGMFDPVLDYGSRQWLDRRIRAPEPAASTTPANPDSQFENYLAGIKDLQAPVSSPSQPYTPTFTPMAAPPAVRVSPPAQFGPVTASGYAQPPVDPMSYYSNPSTASLSNPSTLGGGSEIDYNIQDNPTIRINEGSTDEQDARVYTPRNQEQYIKGDEVLVSPYQAGGTVGVEYLDPSQVAAITAGQTPSVTQGVVTRGETVKIPGKGLPNYEVIGSMDDGSVIYLDPKTRDTFVVPGAKDYPGVVDLSNLPEVVSNVGGGGFRQGTRAVSTPIVPFQETAASVGASEPVTTSQGGFDNTGGSVTAVSSGTTNVTPGYIPKPEVKPGDEFKDSTWSVFDPTGKDDKLDPYTSPSGEVFPTDQNGYKWNYKTQQFDCVGGKCSEKPPVKDTGTTPGKDTGTTTTPPGTGTGTTPTPGGGTPPGGTTTSLPTRPFTPGIPLVRREVVIPTKGTKEVPIPDRQADPFAKLYADLLANAQQQKDQYRYINYDPDQIMNAAMSGFRRRGAMRSLQGY